MTEWWNSLSGIHQALYSGAVFCSVLFLWQLIAVFLGLSGEHGADVDSFDGGDGTYSDFEGGAHADAVETVAAFKLLSVRSIVTFFTLFCWGGALYLSQGWPVGKALGVSTIWGLAGMGSVAAILFALPRLAYTGTKDIATCVGTTGTVYLNIPHNGVGEVRVSVSGVVSHVKARSRDGNELKAGTQVTVVRRLDSSTVEVSPLRGDTREEKE